MLEGVGSSGCLGSLESTNQVDSWARGVSQKHLLGTHCEHSVGTDTLEFLHLADTSAFPCIMEKNKVSSKDCWFILFVYLASSGV